jgi:hypothetical protein
MSASKKKDDGKGKKDSECEDRPARMPARPPADDPMRRHEAHGPDTGKTAGEMARKRLEALRQASRMPTSDPEEGAGKSDKK